MFSKSFSKSRFNPVSGFADFWNEIRRPQPYRLPILALSILPVAGMFYWGMNSTVYGEPERPKVTYITTLDPALDPAEIVTTLREGVKLDSVLSNSFGFGGTNATLVMSKYLG